MPCFFQVVNRNEQYVASLHTLTSQSNAKSSGYKTVQIRYAEPDLVGGGGGGGGGGECAHSHGHCLWCDR